FAVGAIVFGMLAVALIGTVRGTSRVKEDAAIGIVFTTLFALGLVLISVTPSHTDLGHILFGNVLGVSSGDLVQIGVLAGIAFVTLVLRRRDLTLYAFDPTHAQAIGFSPRRLGALLLGLLAVTAVVALQIVGVVLVVAMLIVPGATAHLLTDRVRRMLLLAPTTGRAPAGRRTRPARRTTSARRTGPAGRAPPVRGAGRRSRRPRRAEAPGRRQAGVLTQMASVAERPSGTRVGAPGTATSRES